VWNPTNPAEPVMSTAPAPSLRLTQDRWTLATSILAGMNADTAEPRPPSPGDDPTSPDEPTPNLMSAYTKSEIAAQAPSDSIGLVKSDASADAPRDLRLRPRMGRTSP
jgi:hypothetical protein